MSNDNMDSATDGSSTTSGSDEKAIPSVSKLEVMRAIEVLEAIVEDRGALVDFSREELERVMRVTGQVSKPGRSARRRLVRARKQQQKSHLEKEKEKDEVLLAETGIRQKLSVRALKRAAPPRPMLEGESVEELTSNRVVDEPQQTSLGELRVAKNCYVCKQYFNDLHFFYDSLCPSCSEFNWNKRNQTADLNGRFALLTGGRVKIGFFTGLKLLRAGAHLVVTTRFPNDAAKRYLAEADHEQWEDRLQIHGLDLRHTPSVEAFANHLAATLPHLDFILNNACQTVRRPPGYYGHLMEDERRQAETISDDELRLLASHYELSQRALGQEQAETLAAGTEQHLAGIRKAAELSQIALTKDDQANAAAIFPHGKLDDDLQQIDLRKRNSWRLKLAEVSTIELLEVQLVNAVAPFLLNARLKPLMLKTATRDKHVVNVSAMEGVFYRAFKRDTHPHTNMAKAALNMMTRTSAVDYVKDGIHMNSVDTGWITDEDPLEIVERKRDEHGFHPPLDHIDAAARICDPIFSGINTGNHVWGKFLKDYQVSNW